MVNEITVICSSFVRDMNSTFKIYTDTLEDIVNQAIIKYPTHSLLLIFPEYSWRLTPVEEVLSYVNELKDKLKPNVTLVLGSTEFVHNDKYTNNCIVVHEGEVAYVPKTKILKSESNRGLVSGVNPGVIQIGDMKLGVLVCADLWEPKLLHLLAKQSVDIIAVPAWTLVLKGREKIARTSWHALSRTVSTQYGVVVAVADHATALSDSKNPDNSVGNVTVIFSADNRNKEYPIDDVVWKDIEIIGLDSIRAERQRWKEKGLSPLNID
jgi:predicted amidohydrolase